MLDEKKVKSEELSDDQLDQVTGGISYTAPALDPLKKSRKCINPNCNVMLPYDYPNVLCKKCLLASKGDNANSFPSGPKLDELK